MPSAGWYPDSSGRERWWDGNQWTEHYRPTYVIPATNNMAITALVCGIIGSVLSLTPILYWFAWALGATAVVLGVLAVRKTRNPMIPDREIAIWAIGLGVFAVALGIFGYTDVNSAFNSLGD